MFWEEKTLYLFINEENFFSYQKIWKTSSFSLPKRHKDAFVLPFKQIRDLLQKSTVEVKKFEVDSKKSSLPILSKLSTSTFVKQRLDTQSASW